MFGRCTSSTATGAGTPAEEPVGRNAKEVFTRQQENEASAGKTLNLGGSPAGRVACLRERLF